MAKTGFFDSSQGIYLPKDSLTWNGTGGASYEWYWQGFDGSQSSSALRGPNLLGAELLLDFPIDDHEALTTQEIANINEALNTTELTENEIYDIISGLESVIEEEFFVHNSRSVERNVLVDVFPWLPATANEV